MKRQVSTGYVFTPASSRLDLSAVPGLTGGGLLAVLDVTTGGIVYAVASPGLGASFAGLILTLAAPMTGLAATDTLAILFDDGTATGGSTGTDASLNRPALPNIGAAFAASGPYAGYALVGTVAANPARSYVEVDNSATGPILLLRDDGTAAAGAAPANASLIPLQAAPQAGGRGDGWSSTTFKGRLQVYAPAGTTPQVNIFQD